MLHLSLLRLPRSRRRWRQLDPYQAHQLVWKAFPGVPEGERPFLFSLEDRGRHHSILVQSSRDPDWSQFDGPMELQTKTFDPRRIPEGVPLRFFVRANPTVDRKGFRDGKKRRVAVGINPKQAFERMGRPDEAPESLEDRAAWRERELRCWLERQGRRGAFEVDSCLAGPIVARRLARTAERQRNRPPITIHEVELTGRLRVTDAEVFAAVCARGIGRSKAFGYGLLMLRPA